MKRDSFGAERQNSTFGAFLEDREKMSIEVNAHVFAYYIMLFIDLCVWTIKNLGQKMLDKQIERELLF